MEQRLNVVTLGVGDLAAARAFYARLGWQESAASQEGIAFFQAGGVVLALFNRRHLADDATVSAEGSGFRGISLAQTVRSKSEVAKVLQAAVTAGAQLVKPAQDVFWGGHSGYFADPDGHLWEVAWSPFFPMDENGLLQLPM